MKNVVGSIVGGIALVFILVMTTLGIGGYFERKTPPFSGTVEHRWDLCLSSGASGKVCFDKSDGKGHHVEMTDQDKEIINGWIKSCEGKK